MADETVSSQVYKSRDQIRNQIITLLKQYMELENVDLTKSSFLSFIIEILSTLSSNILFYQISAYREFFLTKAQLPESIYNLAAFLGYTPSDATPAEVNVLFNIPFGFDDASTSFTIPQGFEVSAEGGITFTTYYSTTINVINNSTVTVTIKEGNRTYLQPVTISDNSFYFILPFKQYQTQTQEFQVSDDLQQYQFVSIDVPFSGQLSSLTIQVRPPDSIGYETYTEISSLFLMDASTKSFVKRRTDTGIQLQFGNGLIGYQPEAGSEILVTLNLTDGADGNVIAGSITTGDRVYNTNLAGITEVVNYTITNTSPASNGEDEESMEEVRRNAITNLTSLERLVTKNDFVNANTIIDDSPIGQNSLPVLKRSDLKINEIALFSTLYFNNSLVPTRNIEYVFNTETIPRQTILTYDGVDYYTIYDMTITSLNSSANYSYIMYEIEQIPTLVTSYGSEYDLYADEMTVSRNALNATYQLSFVSSEVDAASTTCQMIISETGATYNMTNDGTSFVYVFSDYRTIPQGELTYYFTISHPLQGQIAQYLTKFIFRKSLSDFSVSNVVTDGTNHTVYDIPVIRKSYYDSINKRDFEIQALQKLLTTLEFKDYKMLTDFINFKFANTTGPLNNMQLNKTDLVSVISIRQSPPTPSGTAGDRYIVGRAATGNWQGYDDYIATLSTVDATSSIWVFTKPNTEETVTVTSESKKYMYSESGWVSPEYTIPLKIVLDIFKDDSYSGSIGDLVQAVRAALVSSFTDRFGINANIYRSEIIDVVQEVDGVEHCRLLQPSSSIFFNFNVDDFSEAELLSYGPEYVYFTTDDITIKVY